MGSFMTHHRESEALSYQAEQALRAGAHADAARLYQLAAAAEALALDALDSSKTRTLGIAAVSAVALYVKAGDYDAASKLAERYLSSPLPTSALEEIQSVIRHAESLRAEHSSRTRPSNLLLLGESLTGIGDEIAHTTILLGSRSGWVGQAFLTRLTSRSDGFRSTLACVVPGVPAKPDTVVHNIVAIESARHADQFEKAACTAVACAVLDCVAKGTIPKTQVEELCIIAGVYIHWQAEDMERLFEFNYQAAVEAIVRAVNRRPTVKEVLDKYKGEAKVLR